MLEVTGAQWLVWPSSTTFWVLPCSPVNATDTRSRDAVHIVHDKPRFDQVLYFIDITAKMLLSHFVFCLSLQLHVYFICSEMLRQSVSDLTATTNELEKELEADEDCKWHAYYPKITMLLHTCTSGFKLIISFNHLLIKAKGPKGHLQHNKM